MKAMKTFRLFSMAALTIMMAACSSEDIIQQQPAQTKGIPFTATISTGGGATTRTTLTEAKDGSNKDILNVVWKENDQVELIYDVAGVTKTTTANVDAVDNGTGVATISATLDANTTDGTAVILRYPAASLNATTHDFDAELLKSQTGTLAGLSDYDWREGNGTLTGIGTSATLSSNVMMNSKVAIWKLSPKAGSSDISATKLSIKNGEGDVLAETANGMTASTTVYLALQPIASQAVFMAASDGTNEYDFSKAGITLAENTYYQSNVTMSQYQPEATPLTFEAVGNGDIYIYNTENVRVTITYKINDGAEQTYSAGHTIYVNAGDKVSFFCTSSSLHDSGSYNVRFELNNTNFYAYGNVMSLIDDSGSGFANDKTISASQALKGIFQGAVKMINHPTKRIVLPATNVSSNCYEEMFIGCTGLKTAPDLPATSLSLRCYKKMFFNCTGLTKAPDVLPATILASECYENMFGGCTSLTKAPVLPDATLVDGCYGWMFSGCSSLNYVKCLVKDLTVGNGSLNSWLNGVSSTGTFVKASTSNWDNSAYIHSTYYLWPNAWTVVTE